MKNIIINIFLIKFLLINISFAQKDYYNTDHNQPLLTEDAYSIEKYGMDFRLSLVDFEIKGKNYHNIITPEIKYSFIDNFHLGVGVNLEMHKESEWKFNGVKEIEIKTFYNFNRENLSLPAFAISAGYIYEINDNENVSYGNLKFIATRSFGKLRSHLNADLKSPIKDIKLNRDNLSFGLAFDYPFPFNSLLMMGEIYNYSKNRNQISLGLRKQLNNSLLIYTSVGTEFGPERKNDFIFKLGFSFMKGLIF